MIDKIKNLGLDKLIPTIYDFGGMTEQETWCKFAQKINIIIEHFNYLDKKFDNQKELTEQKLTYLLGEGMTLEVSNKILELINNGTLKELINIELLGEINTKVDNFKTEVNQNVETFKTEVNEQLDTIENKQFKNEINVGLLRKFSTIKSAIDYAKENGVSKNNRFTIKIDNGTYTEMNTLADGIDIIGQSKEGVIVQYGGTRWRDNDVFFAGFDCSIKNMTIIQISQATDTNLENYAVHLERGNTEAFKCVIENCILKNIGKLNHHALGFGLHDNQNLYVKNCELYSENRSAIYGHNWGNSSPMYAEFDGCRIEGCYVSSDSVKASIVLNDVGAGVREDVVFKNCNIIYPINGHQIVLKKHSGFSGTRNKLFVKCYNTKLFSYSDETDSGKVILDDDFLSIIVGSNNSHLGMPCLLKSYSSNMIECELNIHEENPNVIGVAIPNNDNTYSYVRTNGITYILVDGTKGTVNVLDDLTSTVGAFKKANTGNRCFAKALEAVGNEKKLIKAMLIQPRIK